MSAKHDPFEKIIAAAVEAVDLEIREIGANFAQGYESPIEHVFGTALWAHYKYILRSSDGIFVTWPAEQFEERCEVLENAKLEPYFEYPVYITSQFNIENMRVDFCLAHKNWRTGKVFRVVVECDGHNFHERTKEQAAKDRKRDRVLQEMGFNVFRFTGSELWRDPMGCAEQVAQFLSKKSCEKP